jgi:hypothetical protein
MSPRIHVHLVAAALAVVVGVAPLLAADNGNPTAPKPSDFGLYDSSIQLAPLRQVAAETRYWSHMSALLGKGDHHKLAAAQMRFQIQSAFYSDPVMDPFYDRSRDAVRDGYLKLYKEIMRREYVSDLLDEEFHQRFGGDIGGAHSSWRMRLSPRVAIGSHGYLGAHLSLPKAAYAPLTNFSVYVRHGISDDEMSLALRYQKGNRYWQLERVTGDPDTGKRVGASVVLRF